MKPERWAQVKVLHIDSAVFKSAACCNAAQVPVFSTLKQIIGD
jgi:hypothetical protein